MVLNVRGLICIGLLKNSPFESLLISRMTVLTEFATGKHDPQLWFSPSRQLSTTQMLAHSPQVVGGENPKGKSENSWIEIKTVQ